MGYERDIAAMPKMYDYSRTFFARYYRPDNAVLFIAGSVTPAQDNWWKRRATVSQTGTRCPGLGGTKAQRCF